MENRIQIRHGDDAPTSNDLLLHELGWSDDNLRLYIKDKNGNIKVVTSPNGGITAQIVDWTVN